MAEIGAPAEQSMPHLAFITNLLQQWQLEASEIKPNKRANSNAIYHVTLTSPLASSLHTKTPLQPGTTVIPAGTTKVIFRSPNLSVPFNHSVRVENSVAAANLVRKALEIKGLPAIVPDVYAYGTEGSNDDGTGCGWILEQHMEGTGNAEFLFWTWPKETQKKIVEQMAHLLKAIQDLELPPSLTGYGSIGYSKDGKGDLISVPMVVEPYNGPYNSFSDFYMGMLKTQLKDSEKSPISAGWQRNGIRERIDKFVEEKFAATLEKATAEAQGDKRCLIIGDFNTANLLFDEATGEVTGFIDFDCSHIHHPLHEFFFSFGNLNFLLEGEPFEEQVDHDIRNALLHGFPDPLPPSDSPDVDANAHRGTANPQWDIMAHLDEEMAKLGAARPRTIPDANEVSTLYWFINELCPWYFNSEKVLKARSDEQKEKMRNMAEKKIARFLEFWGY